MLVALAPAPTSCQQLQIYLDRQTCALTGPEHIGLSGRPRARPLHPLVDSRSVPSVHKASKVSSLCSQRARIPWDGPRTKAAPRRGLARDACDG